MMHEDYDQDHSLTIVPAQPGWFVCIPRDTPPDAPYFSYFPVIAWEIRRASDLSRGRDVYNHFVFPITACFEANTITGNVDNTYALRDPDGRYSGLCEQFVDEGHAIGHCLKWTERWKEKRAQRQ